MKYYIDATYESLCKKGEELCGDKVEIVKGEKDVTLVLSDGLGSGVKANILSTLTSKIIATMLTGGATLDECIDTIASTLPVCSERGIAYSTFCILRIDDEGHAFLAQYDCPESIVLRDGIPLPIEKRWREVAGKQIFEANFDLEQGDMIIMISDGVEYAGVGELLNLGWQRENVVDYVVEAHAKGITTAIGMTRQLLGACDSLYMQKPGDDTTVVTAVVRPPEPVYLMVGPPVKAEDDEQIVGELMRCPGKKVVCGGTTSQIVSKLIGEEISVDLNYDNAAVPPIAHIKGIDLVTEGVITLGKAYEVIRDYLAAGASSDVVKLDKKDGATRLAAILINDSTYVKFMVGRAMNPAHQNPNLPLSLSLKMRLVEDVADQLRRAGKQVDIEFC